MSTDKKQFKGYAIHDTEKVRELQRDLARVDGG